jgi:uncharacterized membrane protein YkvA (DUF1232 family)
MRHKLNNFNYYKSYFSESKLWNKIVKVAKVAGIKVIYYALLLYYVTQDPKVSKTDKAKIYGALGYFILPADLLPDTFAVVGFTDDFVALSWALYSVYKNITPEMELRAEEQLRKWFGDFDRAAIAILPPPTPEQMAEIEKEP